MVEGIVDFLVWNIHEAESVVDIADSDVSDDAAFVGVDGIGIS